MAKPKNILAATDLSASGDRAVTYACELAEAVGAKLHVLHVHTPPVAPESVDLALLASGEVEHAGLDHLRRLVAPFAGKLDQGELKVLLGDARAQVVHAAKELGCDLIVVGTHRRRGVKRIVLGSVAEEILRNAPCPVVVVPPGPSA